MIKRINFIEKKAFSFTYQKLMQICMVVVAINFLFIAYANFNALRMDKKLKDLKTEYAKLEQKKAELMKKPVKQKINVGELQGLLDRLESAPKWSILLSEMTESLPNAVWITNFKSASTSEAAVVADPKGSKAAGKKKGKDKNEKETTEQARNIVHQLQISGLSSDVRNITEFTKKLSNSEYFKHPTLSESNQQSYGYIFTIKSEVTRDVQ